MTIERVIDLDQARERARLMSGITKLRGKWRISFTRYRARRSDLQNSFYWAAFVVPFKEWAIEQGNDANEFDEDAAHDTLGKRFLPVIDIRDESGVVIERSRKRSSKLDTGEMTEYLDKCGAWLVEIGALDEMPDPKRYKERE